MNDFVIWLIISFFSTFSFAFLFYKLTGVKRKIDLKLFLVYLFGVVTVVVIKFNDILLLNYIFFFIYFPVLFYIIKPMPIKKILFYALTVWFYGMAVDILLILFLSLIFYFLNINFYNNPELGSILSTFILSLTLVCLSNKKILFNKINYICDKIISFEHYDMVFFTFAIFILAMAVTMLVNIANLDVNVLLLVDILLMVMTFIIIFKYRIMSAENAKYLKTLKENNEFYIKMDDENRVFKHNLIAKLLSIKSVSNKKAMALIEDLILQFNKSIDFSNSIKIIPYGLNGIIYQKLYPYLKDLNIKVNSEINYDIFDVLNPRRYNVLVEKLIVSLDNAIESSLNSEDKSVVINITDSSDEINIEIKNTFSNNINMDMLGNKSYSTKGKKRGLGLFSIFRNNEATVSVKIINNIFRSKITAKKHNA